MKKNHFTLQWCIVFACIFFTCISTLSAQVGKPFKKRYTTNLRGELIMLANNVVSKDDATISANDDYDGNENNNAVNVEYIDVDNDNSTFSSSSSTLSLNECAKVRYAGLYWSGIYPFDRGDNGNATSGTPIKEYNTVKLATPGAGYVDIPADEEIYYGSPTGKVWETSYVCYADVTDIVTPLENPNGDYFVGNVRASQGRKGGGSGGGWVLVIVYEDPNMPGKYISTFDGYVAVSGNIEQDFSYDGFQTIPNGPVKTRIGIAALEGDRRIKGDKMSIKADGKSAFTDISNAGNPQNNFFNSNITVDGNNVTTRNTKSTNTLGFDVDIFDLNNPSNSVIDNNETGLTVKTSTSGDGYGVFLNSLSIDIIEPNIKLTKTVENNEGTDITGKEVNLGQEMYYVIKFRNVGNDHAEDLVIRDALPANVSFIESGIELPPAINGQRVSYTYDASTHSVRFVVPNNHVEINDPEYTIKLKVKVADNCYELRDACSNIIQNLAYASYTGDINKGVISDDPSVADYDVCDIAIPGSTNFLADIGDCVVETEIPLCGVSTTLVAGNGFDSYQWYREVSPGNYVLIPGATSQTYDATVFGNYKVVKTVPVPCTAFDEFFTVEARSSNPTNPFADDADEIVTCTNDGSVLPKFFLCGANDDRALSADNFNGAISFEWQKLNDGCAAESLEDDCPTRSNTCAWTVVGTKQNFTLDGPGEYRLVVTYDGGCFNRYPFKAYENSVDPTITSEDIICDTTGRIEISGIGNGYEYAIGLSSAPFDENTAAWQASKRFDISTAGVYSVYIRQEGVVVENGDRRPCIFQFDNIEIEDKDFTVNAKTINPFCYNDKGSFVVSVDNARAWYTYTLADSNGDIVAEERQTDDNNHTFLDVAPGTYTIRVTTKDGCEDVKEGVITAPSKLNLTAVVNEDIACNDGKITLTASGGTPGYSYTVWSYNPAAGATAPAISYNDISEIPASAYDVNTPSNEFVISEGSEGTYVFLVTDKNNCTAFSASKTIVRNSPVTWSLQETNLGCFQSNDGVISVVHGDTNGYSLAYQLTKPDGTVVNSTDGNFTGLAAGRSYVVTVTQTYGNQSCSSSETINLTEPDRLTASAGVSKLPGCNANDGTLAEVRITNPLGGVPPYTYSFDGGNTYGNTAIGNLAAETHTLYIKDARECTFAMEIVVPKLPAEPTADVAYTYNCDGTGNIVVTPSAPDYEYEYDVNGNLEGSGSSFSFNNLSAGKHTITIHYKNPYYVTYSNLLNEDFGQGANTSSPYIDSRYCYESQYPNDPSDCDPNGDNNREINDGEYSVTAKIDPGKALFGGWISPNDHTDPTNPNGRYMAINIGGVAGVNGVIFKKRVFDVIPNQDISVELEAFNLISANTVNKGDPYLVIQLVGTDGNVIAETNTDRIPRHTDANTWVNYSVELNPGNNEALDIVIRTQNNETNGNDIAIDDILAYQVPEKCDLAVDIDVIIEEKGFTANLQGITDATCSGEGSGMIELAIENFDATQGYQHSIDNGATWSAVQTASPATIKDLPAGAYTILVRDARDTMNCVASFEATIEEPDPITVSATVISDMACSNNYTAVIVVNAEGGTGDYEYQLENASGVVTSFQSSNRFTVVGVANAGDYSITVRDKDGCVNPEKADVTVTSPSPIEFDLSAVACYNGSNGEITATVSEGNGDYQFSLDNATWQNADATNPLSFTFKNLTPGTYTVYVKDGSGCSASDTVEINEQLTASVTSQTNISCVGTVDGTATITVENFQNSYSYSVDGAAAVANITTSTFDLTGLTTGVHTITISDENGCNEQVILTISEPETQLTASIEVKEITCDAAGSVTVTAQNGWGSYSYVLESVDGTITVGPQNTPIFSNLNTSTDYIVTTIDAGGCEVENPFTLNTATPPTVSLDATTDLCYTNGGISLTATASNGLPPYQFRINGGAYQDANVFNNLTPGSYTVEVIDSNGCTASNTAPVVINAKLAANAVLIKDLDCSASSNAEIEITIDGGYPAYQYEAFLNGTSLGSSTAVMSNPFTYSANAAGLYTFEITDTENCTVITSEVEVTENSPATVNPVITAPLCNASADGIVELQISGGVAPYSVIFNGSTASTQTTYSGLLAGTYSYTVTDNKGCVATGNVTVTAPVAINPGSIDLVTDYRCDNTSATIQLTGYSGGTGNYQFSIDGTNFQASDTFSTGITNGTYTITIKDENECEAQATITIDSLNAPTELTFANTALTCPSLQTDVTVSVVGGNAPFNYEITAPAGNIIDNGANATFQNLAVGTYTFRVTDAKGCTIEDTYTIQDIPKIAVQESNVSDVVCNGASDGSITFNVNDFGSTYSYVVENASGVIVHSEASVATSTNTVSNLSAGSYTITVTDDTTNCTATITITVEEPVALDFSTTITEVTCIADGKIEVTATNGWGSYQYQLADAAGTTIIRPYQASNTFVNIPAGTYTVFVQDGVGCEINKPVILNPATPPSIAIEASSDVCYDTTNRASVTISITGGVAPFTYTLNGGGNTNVVLSGNTFTISNLLPNAYTIVVTDAYGCESAAVSTTIQNQLVANSTITKSLDCTTAPDATIEVTLTGGYTPYAGYEVSTDGGSTWSASTPFTGNSFVYTASSAATYQIRITDAEGCSVITEKEVAPTSTPEIANVIPTNILCSGSETGALEVQINKSVGVPPYSIEVFEDDGTGNPGAMSYGSQTTNLPAGNYVVVITDAKECESAPYAVTITELEAINANAVSTDISCGVLGTELGTITINASGGTAPYIYEIRKTDYTYTNSYNTAAPNPNNHVFNNLNFGDYIIRVEDANGCDYTESITIGNPPNLILSTNSVPACSAGTGVITVQANTTDGNLTTGDFYFAIYPNVDPFSPTSPNWYKATDDPEGLGFNTAYTFTNLDPGVRYTFIVHDANTNCEFVQEASIDVAAESTLNVAIDTQNNVECVGEANGSITFTIDPSSTDATSINYEIYSKSNYSGTAITGTTTAGVATTQGGIPPGEYYIYFEEVGGSHAGCRNSSDTFIIDESPRALVLTASATNDNCTNNAGVITATAQYGTAPYEYQYIEALAAAPSATDAGWVSNSTANVESGTYNVYVKDANNCIVSYPITVGLDPTPTISAETTNQCTGTENNFDVTLTLDTVGVAPYYVSVDGEAFIEVTNFTSAGSTQGYSLVTSGTHTFEIKDSNGCGELISIDVYTPLQIEPLITADETCVPGSSGEVTINAVGGSGNFSYELLGEGVTNTTGIFSGLQDGVSYTFEVTDLSSNCTAQTSITLSTPGIPTFTLEATNVNCFGGNNGTITVNLAPESKDAPYTYTYARKGSVAGSPVAENYFEGLSAGTYDVTVISSKGCQRTEEVTISEPSQLVISASASNYTCDESASVVTVTINNDANGDPSGTAPYLYSFDGGNTFQAESTKTVSYDAADVNVVVKDANGCTDDVTVTIPKAQKLTSVPTIVQEIDCQNEEEIIDITAIDGSGDYTYTELPNDTPVANPSNIVITAPGKYVYRIVDNVTNCTIIVEHTVAPYNLIEVSASLTANETCSDSSDGEISVTITGYTGQFSYQIVDSNGNFVANGGGSDNAISDPYTFTPSTTLDSGIYTVQITETESPLCSATSNTVTVISPKELIVNVVANTNANCNEANAVVTVNTSGGTAPYAYAAVPKGSAVPTTFTSDNTLELDPTTTDWDIYVQDAVGCINRTPASVAVSTDIAPAISLSLVDACAEEGMFVIQADFTDAINIGVPPYRVRINGSEYKNVTALPIVFSGLSAQIHTIELMDVNGCVDTETLSISPELELIANVNTQPVCGLGGTIDYTVTGGSGNNVVELFNADGTGTGIVASGSQFTNVSAGVNYIVRVTDNTTNCVKEQRVSLETPTPVNFTLRKKDITCNNANNGSIEVLLDASNNQPPYTYELYQIDAINGNIIGAGPIATQSGSNTLFENLAGGFYRVVTTSNRDCELIREEEIINPPALEITAAVSDSCDPTNGYNITVTLTGIGTAPYSLVVDGAVRNVLFDGNNQFIISGLTVGNHNIGIIDANGCTFSVPSAITITPLDFNLQVTTLLDCQTPSPAGNAVITVSDITGSGDYSFVVEGPNNFVDAGVATGTSFTWSGATESGDYTITLTDTNVGCAIEKTVNVPEKLVPELSIFKENATCFGVENGSITVSAIDNGTGLFTFEITEIDGLVVSVLPDDTTPAFEATFSNLRGSEAGVTYTITATSVNNACTETITETITQPAEITGFDATVEQFVCNAESNINSVAKVTAIPPMGGTGRYRYEFIYDNGTPGDATDDKTQISPRLEYIVANPAGGVVTVNVYDENGCSAASVSKTIDPFVGLEELSTTLVQPTCNTGDGEIQVRATLEGAIGTTNFVYEISKPDGSIETSAPVNTNTYTFTGLDKGSYVVTVTNTTTGCQLKTSATLKNPNTFDVEVEKLNDVYCYGTETGTVNINLVDAVYTGSYTWSIYNALDDSLVKSGTNVASNGINLVAGTYYVEVSQTETPFCTNIAYFNINQSEKPLVLDAEISKYISCVDTGEITATATGGYGFYEYQLVNATSGAILQPWSSTNVFGALSAGTYQVYVRDYKGCDEVFETIILEQPNAITANATQSDVIVCEGETSASIVVSNVTGGRPEIDANAHYLYILNNLDETGNIISSNAAQQSPIFTGLGAGNYSVTVTDSHGCEVNTNSVIIAEPNEVTASLRIDKNNTCETGATLQLTASGGTGNGYEYSTSENGPWIPMAGNSVQIQVPGPIVAAVTHQYFVRDGENCISRISNSVTISPVKPLEITSTIVTDVSCYGEATGYIKVDVVGGLGNYLYTLYDVSGNVVVRPQQTENTFTDLPAGVYFVEVESEDCVAQERVQIEQGNELISKEPVVFNPVCSEDLGRIELELQGGTGTYQFAISPNLDQFQSKNVFEDLEPGIYTIIAQDSRGCNPFVYKKEIVAPSPVEAKANILNKEICAGDKTASFEINIEGGTAPYYTALNTQDDNEFVENKTMFDGLEGGKTYVVFVKDANGCSTNVIVTLDKSIDLSSVAEVYQTCVDNNPTTSVDIIIAESDLENVIYTLDGGADQFENTFTNVAPGEHTVTVSYLGCERTVDFTVDPIDPLALSVKESNVNEFTILPSGGAAPYEYFINGASNGDNNKYPIRQSGVYEVKVIDANGCEAVAQIEMEFVDIDIPNVFTPNGDNNNDTWAPKNSFLYPEIAIRIYDRYGRVVAELGAGEEWDGRYNGALLPTGDYWYVIKLNGDSDDREFVGHFTLYR